ncbi:hypothetical protein [Sanguibacter massiliensis]|uniref:hypothetical protein n=1 Tax=Sanguibacter massiliensis TaxID=1973217 RepID=UPI00101ADA47|nr:hypothetical protein [Sanguibacter massiliensis]
MALVALEALVFRRHWSGELTIPWDFTGTYNAEAFAWWEDGGLLHPQQWMPYQWGGYPAAASVQNSSDYLPVGLMSLVMPFSIHAATILHALHAALGAAGAYIMVRRMSLGRYAAAFALVAWFFAVGYYSNAQHVDIARGFAWAPWIIVCVSPWWPWRRWWSIPLAGVLLWQAAISTYPGLLVQIAYGAVALVVVWQVTARPHWRRYLLPLGVAAVGALLLTLHKYIPNLLTRGVSGSPQQPEQAFDLGILGTVYLPYDFDWLPNDLSMRSFFVVAGVLPLVLFARLRSPGWWTGLALAATGILLGVPGPWNTVTSHLPGMSLSRFQLADSRVLMTLGLVVLAAEGFARVLDRVRSGGPGLLGPVRSTGLVVLLASALGVALGAGFPTEAWRGPWLLMVGITALIALAASPALAARGNVVASLVVVGVLAAATFSGTTWANENHRPWRVDRLEEETRLWGVTSDELIAARDTGYGGVRRPARVPLPEDATPEAARWPGWSLAYFNGRPTLGGYVNLFGVPSFDAVYDVVMREGPLRQDAIVFWEAPGMLVEDVADGVPSTATVGACLETGACGRGLEADATGYTQGEWHYRTVADAATRVVLNETFYPGFVVTACSSSCVDLPVSAAASGGVAFDLPAGTNDVTIVYRTPGWTASWIVFWAGFAVLGCAASWRLGAVISTAVLSRRGRRSPVVG